MVDGRLFTGSHDATLRVWDTLGVTDDTSFGRDANKQKQTEQMPQQNMNDQTDMNGGPDESPENDNTKIMIEDENMNGHAQINGNFHGVN